MGIMLLEMTMGEKLVQGLLVTVIGVLLVFVILALLIYLAKLLKQFNSLMDLWDSYMLRYRALRGEIKSTKRKTREIRAKARLELANCDKAERDKRCELIESEFAKSMAENQIYFAQLLAEFDEVTVIDKARRKEIAGVKAETRAAIRTAKKLADKAESDAKKIIINTDTASRIADINAKYQLKIAAVGNASSATAQPPQGINDCDDELIAVISAAIAIATAQEAQAKKVQFRVRNIREVRS